MAWFKTVRIFISITVEDPKKSAEELHLGSSNSLHLSRLKLGGSSAEKAEDGARLFTVGHDMRMGHNKHKLK